MNALIVDDEPLAREYLRRQCELQDLEILGEADNALQGLELCESLRPDIVFLDIQMPGLSGLQAAAAMLQLESPPQIVFVTGFSQYAVDAFEQDAMDYLVKPIDARRLAKTISRARERLSSFALREELANRILDRTGSMPAAKRIPVRGDYVVKLVRVEDIQYAVARDKRVYLRTAEEEHRTYYTLKQLETMLPPEQFLRLHDSYLANIEMIDELIFLGNHSYAVKLSNGIQLPVGRTRYSDLQKRLGLETGL